VFLREPVRHITPARLARPDTLLASGVTGSLRVLPGYGDLDSIPGGGPQPLSEWDGWRRIKISAFAHVVAPEWASWSVPGVVCFGDSGSPTFRYDPSNRRTDERVVAVASDGGDVCFSRDDRARVDTAIARDWVRRTIAQHPSGSQGAPSASTEDWQRTSSRTAMTGPLPARAPASCRHCRRRRGRLYRRASPWDARVRMLAAGAAAPLAAVADLTALTRSGRHRRWILAAAGALSPNAGLAYTDVRLSGHEKLLF
jgi:hypothetical protein